MAKKAMVERNLKREKTVDKYAAKRAELKERAKKVTEKQFWNYLNCLEMLRLQELETDVKLMEDQEVT